MHNACNPYPPQGPRSGAPEVPGLPSAWGHNWATWPQGDINSGEWPSRLRIGCKASDPTLLLQNLKQEITCLRKPKPTDGCSANEKECNPYHVCKVAWIYYK
jgi:hypothetical protein